MHTVGANQVTKDTSLETDLISLTDNPASGKGVIIRTFSHLSENNGQTNILRIDGEIVWRFYSNDGRYLNAPPPLPLFVEAGKAVTMQHGDAGSTTDITYDKKGEL